MMTERERIAIVAIPLATALAVAAIIIWTPRVRAHDAPTGWSYPYNCCSGIDCRPVPASMISEGPNGYTIKATGEVIGYRDAKIKFSPDGLFHWCSVAGRDDGKTICLFVPPSGS